MSDFLSRLAARAVGAQPSARPRLPSLYEAAPRSADGIEILDEAVPGSPPSSPIDPAPDEPAADPGVEAKVALADASAAPPSGERSRPGSQPAEPRAPAKQRSPRVLAAMQRRSADGDAALREEPAPPEPPTVERAAEPPVAPLVAARPAPHPGPAAVPPPARSSDARARVALIRPAATEGSPDPEPAVRVHIGRLEVRAVIGEPPRPRAQRHQPPPASLSLGDYLRGRREAG